MKFATKFILSKKSILKLNKFEKKSSEHLIKLQRIISFVYFVKEIICNIVIDISVKSKVDLSAIK